MLADPDFIETIAKTVDTKVQSTKDQKLTAEYVQNAIEDLISSDQLIEGVTKVLVDNSVTLAEAFKKECTQQGVIGALVQAVKEHELFLLFLRSCVTPVLERIAAEYSENMLSTMICTLMKQSIAGDRVDVPN